MMNIADRILFRGDRGEGSDSICKLTKTTAIPKPAAANLRVVLRSLLTNSFVLFCASSVTIVIGGEPKTPSQL